MFFGGGGCGAVPSEVVGLDGNGGFGAVPVDVVSFGGGGVGPDGVAVLWHPPLQLVTTMVEVVRVV